MKKENWCSDNLRKDHQPICLSSLALDMSDKSSTTKPLRGDKFVYRFVHRESPLVDSEQVPGYSRSSSSFKSIFKNGDYVVCSLSFSSLSSDYPCIFILFVQLYFFPLTSTESSALAFHIFI